ncbi:hypothetical protein WS62_18540 [Burkholderia sp. ABCPW 14]|nr:hypothetical protein WS62_18540 [Burkholderia sp. ABCPW 14]
MFTESRRAYLLGLIMLLATLVAGCGGSDITDALAPAGLTYDSLSTVYVQGTAIIPNSPNSSGGAITQYSVEPALPAGLNLDPQSGVISGTPSAVSNATLYTVTGSNATGSATARIQIEVQASAAAPDRLSYVDESVIYVTGSAITPNRPTSIGGEITQYSVAPALPAGLSLDPQTGVITGTPTAVTAPAVYTVTGSNSVGSVTAQLNIEVRAQVAPPASLQYADPAPVYVTGQPIVPDAPQSTGGEITQYSISPTLPAGLSMDAQTGVISGTPGNPQAQTTYTVTGSNSVGSVQAQVLITVVSESVGEWLPADDMAAPRESHTATLLQNNKVLVVGGQNANGVIADATLYDPASGTWSPTGLMAAPREGHTATLLQNGNVLVTGGQDTSGGAVATAELYDPTSGTWSSTGRMAAPREGHTATLLQNGNVLVTGGQDTSGGAVATAELYDPTSGTWSSTGSMATPRERHTATLLQDSKVVLVTGGQDASGSPVATAELYDPTSGTWSPTGSMATPREGHTATPLQNGKVLVAGGDLEGVFIIDTAELYDPASGKWSATGSLLARQAHTATRLLDGKVLVAGGQPNTNGAIAAATLYDPTSGTWSPTGRMAAPREGHTATLLQNGNVLVTGGQDTSGGAVATAELFH